MAEKAEYKFIVNFGGIERYDVVSYKILNHGFIEAKLSNGETRTWSPGTPVEITAVEED